MVGSVGREDPMSFTNMEPPKNKDVFILFIKGLAQFLSSPCRSVTFFLIFKYSFELMDMTS